MKDWPSAGPSASVRHALRRSQYARAGVILQNDRRDEEVAADGGGVLLAPSGVRCRPGKCKELLFRDENSAVSNAPPNAPETARLHADVPSNDSAGNLAALIIVRTKKKNELRYIYSDVPIRSAYWQMKFFLQKCVRYI